MKKTTIAAVILAVLLTAGCTNITPQDMENAKQAFLSNDSSKCEKITDKTTQGVCIMTIAQKTKNPELCDKIADNQSKDGCITSIAFSTQNPTLCERLSQLRDRNECKKSVGEIKTDVLAAVLGAGETETSGGS